VGQDLTVSCGPLFKRVAWQDQLDLIRERSFLDSCIFDENEADADGKKTVSKDCDEAAYPILTDGHNDSREDKSDEPGGYAEAIGYLETPTGEAENGETYQNS